ncbi:hypothetical protein ACHHV8_29310 [Paenibacillus sp. TAB 01]|uniref:hypothetical protein n=1 Tax=Paenibacillus sp. TAB 01 TaxID=3368988 RepID=UPI003750ACAE
MTIKHSIPCEGSEVTVRHTGTDTYQVSIQAVSNNPLGTGNVLETFSNLDEAIQAAELFCRLHTTAKEMGYYLDNGHFIKPDRPKLHIGTLLQEGTPPERLSLLLK